VDSITFKNQKHGMRLPLADLNVDLAVQRAIMAPRVRKIMKNFDEAAVGELLVSEREDGFYILDGHHRAQALQELNGRTHVDCEVFEGLSKADEARLFLLRNDRANVARVDRHRNMATLGDPRTLNVNMACEANGFIFIANSAHERTFSDLDTANSIMQAAENGRNYEGTGEQHLSRVLGFYARVWGASATPESVVLKTLSRLFLRREPDEDRLYDRLRDVPPQQLVYEARVKQEDLRETRNITLPSAMLDHIVGLYNHGLPQISSMRIKL
jgi:hypothetical protein